MRLPRKGILIRLAIYLPLIGFFGWQAVSRYLDERKAEAEAEATRSKLDALPPEQFRTFTLPDGTVKKVPVLTPEQAEEIYGVKVPEDQRKSADDEPAAPAPTPEPTPEAIQGVPGE